MRWIFIGRFLPPKERKEERKKERVFSPGVHGNELASLHKVLGYLGRV